MKKNYVYVKESIPRNGGSWTPHIEFDVDIDTAKRFTNALKNMAKAMIGYEDCDYENLKEIIGGVSEAMEAIKQLEEYYKNEDEVQSEEDDI